MAVGQNNAGETVLEFDQYDDKFVLTLTKEQFSMMSSTGAGLTYTPTHNREHVIRVKFKEVGVVRGS